MAETMRHGLPLLAAGQAQKEVTHNEALLAIDRQLQLAVETRALAAPPAAPAAGANYIVATAATGAWTDHSGDVATFDGFGWIFWFRSRVASPGSRMRAYLRSTATDGRWAVGRYRALI